MTIIDRVYQSQLSAMHSDGKFNNGHKAYEIVKDFLGKYKPTSVLDFGCGHGALIATIDQLHPNIKTAGYDPGNDRFKEFPTIKFDAVVSTDALEHIEPEFLVKTLIMISDRIDRCGFFRIACYPAKKKLPDGRNAHLVVQHPTWWREQILTHMNVEIVNESITVVDKTQKWDWVKGHNYDVTVLKKR